MYSEPCPPPQKVLLPVAITDKVQCLNRSITAPGTCPAGSIESGGYCKISGTEQTPTGVTYTTTFVGKTCPAGYINDRENPEGLCIKADPPVCPSGQSVRALMAKQSALKAFCVPDNVVTTPLPGPGKPGIWPCADDAFFDAAARVCVPPPSINTPTPAPAPTTGSLAGGGYSVNTPAPPQTPSTVSGSVDQYIAEYDALVNQAIATNDAKLLPEIRKKSEQVQAALNKQIESLTYLKKETPDIKAERDHLLEQLRRVQRDYGGLADVSDDLTTLRRIREQEGGEFNRQLYLYLAFFFGLVLVVLLLVFFMGGQKAVTTAMSPATPSMRPALT